MSVHKTGNLTSVSKPIKAVKTAAAKDGNSRFENMVAMPEHKRKSKILGFLSFFK